MLPTIQLRGQGSRADYDRALSLPQRTENKVFRQRVKANWLPGGTNFWYRVKTGPEMVQFVQVDAVSGIRTLITAPPGDSASLTARKGDNAPRRSRLSTTDTEINFVNQTHDDVEIF